MCKFDLKVGDFSGFGAWSKRSHIHENPPKIVVFFLIEFAQEPQAVRIKVRAVLNSIFKGLSKTALTFIHTDCG